MYFWKARSLEEESLSQRAFYILLDIPKILTKPIARDWDRELLSRVSN